MSQPPVPPGNPNGGSFQPGSPNGRPLPPQGTPPTAGPYPGPGMAPQPPNGANFAAPGQQPPFQPPAKKRKGKGCLIAVLIVVALIVIVAIGSALNGGGSKASPGTSSTTEAAATGSASTQPGKATTAAAAMPGIGAAVTDGDLQFTGTAYKCGVTVKDARGALAPQGQFCQLDLTIKNTGKTQATVDSTQINLLDAAGVEYSTSSDTLMVDGNIFLKQVNPGNSITGSAYFDVPKEVSPTVARVKGGLFSKGTQIKVA